MSKIVLGVLFVEERIRLTAGGQLKLFRPGCVLACSLALIFPYSASSLDTPSRLYLPAGTDNFKGTVSADEIVREDSPNPTSSPYASIVRLKGHVEIQMC